MNSKRELTHPSWRRQTDAEGSHRESLMSQMVRAQLIFDRRTPANGLPAWRDVDADASAVQPAGRLDARIGIGAGEFLVDGHSADGEEVVPAGPAGRDPVPFADELAERLQLARDRVEVEHVHLTQVGTVADAYLGRPNLRLVK